MIIIIFLFLKFYMILIISHRSYANFLCSGALILDLRYTPGHAKPTLKKIDPNICLCIERVDSLNLFISDLSRYISDLRLFKP